MQKVNANQNHNEISFEIWDIWNIEISLLEWLLSKRQEMTIVGEDVEKRKP